MYTTYSLGVQSWNFRFGCFFFVFFSLSLYNIAAMIFNASEFKSSVSVAATPTTTPIESTQKVQSHKIYDKRWWWRKKKREITLAHKILRSHIRKYLAIESNETKLCCCKLKIQYATHTIDTHILCMCITLCALVNITRSREFVFTWTPISLCHGILEIAGYYQCALEPTLIKT